MASLWPIATHANCGFIDKGPLFPSSPDSKTQTPQIHHDHYDLPRCSRRDRLPSPLRLLCQMDSDPQHPLHELYLKAYPIWAAVDTRKRFKD